MHMPIYIYINIYYCIHTFTFIYNHTYLIQCRDIQSVLYVLQKYCFCEDCMNLFCAQLFLLGFLRTNLGEFWKFPLSKLASILPYASSLAIKRSWGRQPKAFDRWVSNAPNAPPLSTLFVHFSIRLIQHCCAL